MCCVTVSLPAELRQMLHTALSAAERELPVLSDAGAAMAAAQLLHACHAAGATEWALALALALDNTLVLRGAPMLLHTFWPKVTNNANLSHSCMQLLDERVLF